MPRILHPLLFALMLCAPLAAQDAPEIVWQEDGISPYYSLGWSVAWAGDVNGDGADEFVSGAPGRGKIHLYDGASKSLISEYSGGIRLGTSMVALGDVNLDGITDIAAGSPYINGNTGEVKVLSGADFSELYTLSGTYASQYFAWNLARTDDNDGDGLPDLLVFCYDGDGSVRVHNGAVGFLRFEVFGSPGMEFGGAVAGIHDFDGDGHADFLVGAPEAAGGGLVTMYSGANGSVLATLSEAGSERFGDSLAALGDIDGDGIPDLAVGAPDTTKFGVRGVGEMRVYSGADLSLLRHRSGSAYLQKLGAHIADAGDYDEDGFADFLVSSPGADANGVNRAGIVELISGATAVVLGTAKGTIAYDSYPSSIAGNGDSHRDLHPDVLIGHATGGSKLHGRLQMWGAPSPWLQVSNLTAGATATLTASLCQAGSRLQYWASLAGSGPTVLSMGTVLLEAPFHKLGFAIAGIDGIAELNVHVPATIGGQWIHTQAIEIPPSGDLRTSTGLSAVVQ